jgi:anti-sigma B factor antagonist
MENIKISLGTGGADGEISVVRVDGVIDTMTATELEKVMNSLLDQKRYSIVIDLGGVDYISSAGWGIFISNIREIRQNEGDIKLARLVPNVREIFELLEFDSILQCFDNVEKAKQDFETRPRGIDAPEEHGTRESMVQKLTGAGASVTVADPAVAVEQTVTIEAQQSLDIRERPADLESRVLELVREDPFYSISEMKRIINTENSLGVKAGWWKVRSILKAHDLISKRKRFRYARKG